MKKNSTGIQWQTFLFLLCIQTCFLIAEDPTALYLSWQHSPDSSMTVLWITPEGNYDSSISIRSDDNDEWKVQQASYAKLPEKTPYILHTAEFTQLQPDKTYLFRINDNKKIYKFHTLPSTLSHPISFVAGGDMYHDDIESMRITNRQAALTKPDFALVGGDIAYASGRYTGYLPKWAAKTAEHLRSQKFDRWLDWIQAWSQDMVTPEGYLIPLIPIIGNHDTSGGFDQTPASAPFFYALFPMPGNQGYNVLDFGNYLSLFLLDSGHTHPMGDAQSAWLSATLEQRQHTPYKCALYHVPAYPSYRPFDNEYSTQVRNYWVPLFEQFHINLAFEHHDHDYKRTYPIRNGAIDPSGVVYVGDGAWGVKHPRTPKGTSRLWYLAKSEQARHFIYVELGPEGFKGSAIRSDGSEIDKFYIPPYLHH